MKILFVGGEANPFIKTGGLGDVLGSLPKSLVNEGIDIRVVIPKYKNINKNLEKELKFLKWFMVNVGWRTQYCGVFEYEKDGVIYYLLDNEYYFGRDSLYGYGDDAERFAYFDRAALDFLKEIGYKPDIIHCNDWHTGMIPVVLKLEYSKDLFYRNIKSVFSIHNLKFQGVFSKEILPDLFGYELDAYYNNSLAFDGGVSFLKGGVIYSDKITTVSKSYVNEIMSPEFGERMDSDLRRRKYDLTGIVNGIDYDEFNPDKDNYIYNRFNYNNLEGKVRNKEQLQKELGLPVNKEAAMIGIVSRLTNQKGLDLVVEIADRLLQCDVQLVVLGTGDYIYEEHFKSLAYRYRDKVSANIKFDNMLAHKVYAASDMFLMPSLFEPCGLGQLIALRYGAIPIVREVGGLKDTISPYNQNSRLGNGFGFTNYNGNELFNILKYALEIFKDKNQWNGIIKQAMESNNSWEKAAKDYINLYEKLMK